MNSLFGDATTAAPTPATLAEAESLFSGNRSPVSSLRLGDDGGPIPDMDLAPPDVEIQDGKAVLGRESEGVQGWISGMLQRGKSDEGSGKYKRVGQDGEGG